MLGVRGTRGREGKNSETWESEWNREMWFGVINLKRVLLTGLCFLWPCPFTAQARWREGSMSYWWSCGFANELPVV